MYLILALLVLITGLPTTNDKSTIQAKKYFEKMIKTIYEKYYEDNEEEGLIEPKDLVLRIKIAEKDGYLDGVFYINFNVKNNNLREKYIFNKIILLISIMISEMLEIEEKSIEFLSLENKIEKIADSLRKIE